MSQTQAQSVPPPFSPRPGKPSSLKDAHFLVAVGVLLSAVVGFSILATMVTLIKLPVPAKGVTLDDQRLASFPGKLGAYALWPKVRDGDKIGLIKVPPDEIELLGIRQHEANWYYMAVYQDQAAMKPPIQLDLTYYTGLLDAVPHVSDNCIVAGGGRILEERNGPVTIMLDGASGPWSQVQFQRTAWETDSSKDGRHVYYQYHVFSVNGVPMTDRNDARIKLSNPFKKYFYYAKIQIAPFAADMTPEQSDALCRDFLTCFLPEILKSLPTEQDVRQLEGGR